MVLYNKYLYIICSEIILDITLLFYTLILLANNKFTGVVSYTFALIVCILLTWIIHYNVKVVIHNIFEY
jgi:hypothetical protein